MSDYTDADEAHHLVLAPLIRAIASSPEMTYAAGATNRFASWLTNTQHGLRKAAERDGRGQPLIPYRYVKMRCPIPFSICVHIAARLKIGLDTYLTGETLEWNRSIFPDEAWCLPALPMGFVPASTLTPSELSSRIEKLHKGCDSLQALSLCQTATTLGLEPLDIVFLTPELAQNIHSADVIRGIVRKQLKHTCTMVEHYQRVGRESANKPRVKVIAMLERDFPELTPEMIATVVDRAMTDLFARKFPSLEKPAIRSASAH